MTAIDDDFSRVPRVKGRSRAEIHQIAHNFVRGFQETALFHPEKTDVVEALEHLVDEWGADYRIVESLGHRTEGETLPGGIIEIPEATFRGARQGNPRDRVTILHECGHVVMHSDELESASKRRRGPTLFRRDELKPFEDPEWQAFEFALYALAPTKPVMGILGGPRNDRWSAETLASKFGLSVPAAESRLRSLQKYRGIPR